MPKNQPPRPGLHQKGERAPNPFEVRDQRKKHDILGRKSKGDKNKTGIARAAGVALRQKTLGVELQQKGKANLFADRRFAEADETMPEEEKMLLRFQKERQKSLFKKSIFNLDEEEATLTHRGQALSTMNTFEDDYGSSEDEAMGEIDEATVNAAHFGGFEPKRPKEGEEEGDEEERTKTKKEVMEEVIAKSKYYRAEKAKEKEEHSELKEKLDEEYREIAELLKGSAASATAEKQAPKKPEKDNYDVIVRELAFDLKARPTDRTKTQEELVREERDRLELLEKQRLMRMHDQHDHSAPGGDDLDEGYFEAVEEAKKQELGGENEVIRKKQTVALPFPTKESAAAVPGSSVIPFTIPAPTSAEELKKLTDKRSHAELATIFNRILVCTHPSLAPGNKDKLKVFYGLLLDFMIDAAALHSSAELINTAYHTLLTLVQALPDVAAELTRARLTAFQEALNGVVAAGTATKAWNHTAFVCLLQFIFNVYPVTDFQHSIVTPAMLVAGQFLAQYPLHSAADVSAGLLVCSVLRAATSRYLPEALGFLANVTASFHDKPSVANPAQFAALDLRLAAAAAKGKAEQSKPRVELLHSTLSLVADYAALYRTNDAFAEAFAPIARSLAQIRAVAEAHAETKELHRSVLETVKKSSEAAIARRSPLQKLLRKPAPLKSFNPKYEEKFDPTASYDPDKERVHMQKLKAQLKKEQKGAMRELKKDAAFIQAEKEKKRREQKVEVADRLKRAVANLSAQEQEVNIQKQEAKRRKSKK